jgi:hypothetical protein
MPDLFQGRILPLVQLLPLRRLFPENLGKGLNVQGKRGHLPSKAFAQPHNLQTGRLPAVVLLIRIPAKELQRNKNPLAPKARGFFALGSGKSKKRSRSGRWPKRNQCLGV